MKTKWRREAWVEAIIKSQRVISLYLHICSFGNRKHFIKRNLIPRKKKSAKEREKWRFKVIRCVNTQENYLLGIFSTWISAPVSYLDIKHHNYTTDFDCDYSRWTLCPSLIRERHNQSIFLLCKKTDCINYPFA